MLSEKIIYAIESEGWTVSEDFDGSVEIGIGTPAGGEYCFPIAPADMVNEDAIADRLFVEYYSFDVDEYVEMWLSAKRSGTSGVPSATELLEDAQEIERWLRALANAVCDAIKE